MTLEEEKTLLFQSLGEAFSAWSSVESALCMLFSVLLCGRPTNGRLSIVFYAIENFRSKQQVVDSLARSCLANHTFLERWEPINKRLPQRAARRNKLAHHDVLEDPDGKSGRRVALVPPMFNPKTVIGLSTGKVVPLYHKDIDQIRIEMLELTTEIHRLAREIELSQVQDTTQCQ